MNISAEHRIKYTLKNGFTLAITAFPEYMIMQLPDLWQTVAATTHYFNLAKAGLSNLVNKIFVIKVFIILKFSITFN